MEMTATNVLDGTGKWAVDTGDSMVWLKTLPEKTVRCSVTSPPYYGLRDYETAEWEGGSEECDHKIKTKHQKQGGNSQINGRGNVEAGRSDNFGKVCLHCGAVRIDPQIGIEETPGEYVRNLVLLFRRVRRVLTDDGTLWLNLGDSYNAKNLMGMPWRVAFALQEDGWYLRSDIIWWKRNKMPESVTDRPTMAHEYLFLLSKSEKYYYDYEAIRERATSTGGGASFGKQKHDGAKTGAQSRKYDRPEYEWRNKRSVWDIPTKSYHGAHFAVMPKALVHPCILAGSEPGDVILDPFIGSGTVLSVAVNLCRRGIGCELNPEYAALARKRIGGTVPGLI